MVTQHLSEQIQSLFSAASATGAVTSKGAAAAAAGGGGIGSVIKQ